MRRTNLGRLLDVVDQPHDAPVEQAEAPTEPVATPRPAPVSTTGREGESLPEPLYLHLVRKDVRLREDQLAALTVEARRLNRARRSRGHRITENTLIRIAVDLLLDRSGALVGDDEDELRTVARQ